MFIIRCSQDDDFLKVTEPIDEDYAEDYVLQLLKDDNITIDAAKQCIDIIKTSEPRTVHRVNIIINDTKNNEVKHDGYVEICHINNASFGNCIYKEDNEKYQKKIDAILKCAIKDLVNLSVCNKFGGIIEDSDIDDVISDFNYYGNYDKLRDQILQDIENCLRCYFPKVETDRNSDEPYPQTKIINTISIRNVSTIICDMFENLLEERDITIPNNEREGECDEARIFGNDYYNLEDDITDVLEAYVKLVRNNLTAEMNTDICN